MEDKTSENLKSMIAESKKIAFFGGAGVSTESGIPDFRSKDGLYNQKYDRDPEYILSIDCFQKEPELFWKFYRDKILIDGVQPNDAHKALAKLEADGKLTAVITQNIDNLHELAGSKTVYHVHGTITTNHCVHCKRRYSLGEVKQMPLVPRCSCSKKGSLIKPDVVLYGELLPEKEWEASVAAIRNADMLIVAGTSLRVNPAATLIRYFSGKNFVIINRDATPSDFQADLVIHDSVGKVLGSAVLR